MTEPANFDGVELKNTQNRVATTLSKVQQVLSHYQPSNNEQLDLKFKGEIASACNGLSPLELTLAYLDWISHLTLAPGKRLQLLTTLTKQLGQLGLYSLQSLVDSRAEAPFRLPRHLSTDRWKKWPFNLLAQTHQASKEWWQLATSDVEGVTHNHQQLVAFFADQFIEAISPANFLLTNPDVLAKTKEEHGKNLLRGLKYRAIDLLPKTLRDSNIFDEAPAHEFQVGVNVATTAGEVIFQNHIIELIQYTPLTESVDNEPVLIFPPWIMKFYILDLSPKNSMIKYLVEQGKTVFVVSWKNPVAEDRDTTFLDYLHYGFYAALDSVSTICPEQKINTVGYCLGGTMLCIGAADMARKGDERLNSITLFASQADFSEAGEITQYISESQLAFLDNLMWKKGVLGSENMGASFAYMRPADLIHQPKVDRYLMGNKLAYNDLMAWNADGTRMPYRMHSEYLHKLYLNNDLACNRFVVDDKPVSLADIRVPLFNLGTDSDHVAPWLSVYKINQLVRGEVTFCLTSGGHNAGVISGAEHPRRKYRISTQAADAQFIDASSWVNNNELQQGSWWPAWLNWLNQRSSGQRKPPAMGAPSKGLKPLRKAPGDYVMG